VQPYIKHLNYLNISIAIWIVDRGLPENLIAIKSKNIELF